MSFPKKCLYLCYAPDVMSITGFNIQNRVWLLFFEMRNRTYFQNMLWRVHHTDRHSGDVVMEVFNM